MAQYATRDSLTGLVRSLTDRVRRLESALASVRRIYDSQGNVVAAGGASGLSRPYLPVWFRDAVNPPTATTSLTTWTTLQTAPGYIKQHPRISLTALVSTSIGTTGEIRLWDSTNGVQIGATVTVEDGVLATYTIGPAAAFGEHMTEVDLAVQGRVVSGSGSIGIAVRRAYGVGE